MIKVRLLFTAESAGLGEKIANALAAGGYSLAFGLHDEGDLDPQPVRATIVIWSPAATRDPGLVDAAQAAFQSGALVPVAIGRGAAPPEFEAVQPADLAGWCGAIDDPRWKFVLEEITLAAARSVPEVRIDMRPPPPRLPRKALAGAVLTTCAAIVVGAALLAGFPRGADGEGGSRLASAAAAGEGEVVRRPDATAETALLEGEPATDMLSMADPPAMVDGPAPASSGSGSALRDLPAPSDVASPGNAAIDAPAGGPPAAEPLTALVQPPAPSEVAPEAAASQTLAAPTAAPATADQPTATQPTLAYATPATATSEEPDLIAELAWVATAGGGESESGGGALGNYFKECVDCPDMAVVPAGRGWIGAGEGEPGSTPAERPQRSIVIAREFAIGTREITVDQWQTCHRESGCARPAPNGGEGRGQLPVTGVSHQEARDYTRWLSVRTGGRYRLPSEAEWEYAARAGAEGPFWFEGPLTTAQANFDGSKPLDGPRGSVRGWPMPVGSFAPNPFGLYDVHGNVWEWTEDCWSEGHAGRRADAAPVAAGSGIDCNLRVIKSGSFAVGGAQVRASHRVGAAIDRRASDKGFRVVRDLP